MILLLLLALQDAEPVDFRRDVRPILSDNCFKCHGPDEKNREGDLRLDTPEEAHKVFVPGKPDASEGLKRLVTEDKSDRMPPRKSGKTLAPKQIDTLRRWVAQGAPWAAHWAFVAPERPPVPKAAGRTAVDAFLAARLRRDGLSFSPEADRPTLLRRLSLDLTGLPPSPAEVDAFVNDPGPDAYEKQVERLLSSPHYGERQARHWLDAARYADSDGYEKDKPREVWFYRDWVIRAFNRDLPYDRFIVDQIAGDLSPDGGQDGLVATGFLRNSMINEEGGVDPEQFRMEAMFDRMDALGRAVLGITVQCAQCHTHKYDPLTQEDYYRMFAFLNDAHEAMVTVYTPEQQAKRTEILRGIREIEAGLRERAPDWREKMRAWEAAVRPQPGWTVIRPEADDISTGGSKYLPQPDGSFLAQGYAPTKHRVKLTAKVDLPSITGIRLELLNDPNLPHGGPGRSLEGTAALTEVELEAGPADGSSKPARVKLVAATSDVELPEAPLKAYYDDRSKKKRVTGPVAYAIDGNDLTAWGIDAGPGRRNQPRKAVFVPEKPVAFPGGAIVTVYLKQNHGGWNSDDNQTHNLGRFRLSVTGDANPTADPLSAVARAAIETPEDRRSPAQQSALFSAWRETAAEWAEADARIEALWREHPEGASQLALRTREARRTTHMLHRGDFLKPEKAVEPGVPGFLHPLPDGAPRTRLTFARWLVDRRSPTTARAFVNRAWQNLFGTGLVATSEDLGSQAQAPSHPELMDWLAVDFMEQGWSVKSLLRLLVTSTAYRQSSRVTPELLAKDPANRLLARGPRFRVEGEVVRDIALAASGKLNPEIGGPSVYPPAPGFLFQPPVSYGPKTWLEAKGDDRYRRAMYTFRYRSVPYPPLEAFDTPNGDASCVRRSRSNTPLQALTTLNEPLFVELAQALGERVKAEGGATDRERIDHLFRLCTARAPSEKEAGVLLGFLSRHREGKGMDAWTAVARVVLNLDETITKE